MTQPPRDLPVEIKAVMAAIRLTLTPDDVQALADLRERAALLQADLGESERRRAFRVAAQACAVDPSRERLRVLAEAMADFNRHELLPLSPPSEDRRPGRGRVLRPGGNGVAASMPADSDDINIDL